MVASNKLNNNGTLITGTHEVVACPQPTIFCLDLFNTYSNYPQTSIIKGGSSINFSINTYHDNYNENIDFNLISKKMIGTNKYRILFHETGNIDLEISKETFVKQELSETIVLPLIRNRININDNDGEANISDTIVMDKNDYNEFFEESNIPIPDTIIRNDDVYNINGYKICHDKLIFMSNNSSIPSYYLPCGFPIKALYLSNYENNGITKTQPIFKLIATDYDLQSDILYLKSNNEEKNIEILAGDNIQTMPPMLKNIGITYELSKPTYISSLSSIAQLPAISEYLKIHNPSNIDNDNKLWYLGSRKFNTNPVNVISNSDYETNNKNVQGDYHSTNVIKKQGNQLKKQYENIKKINGKINKRRTRFALNFS